MLVDDHELIREAVCSILDQEHDITVVAGCGGGQEALERLEQARPDGRSASTGAGQRRHRGGAIRPS
jgi:DNA-binding NarL/FixJ family response regulator